MVDVTSLRATGHDFFQDLCDLLSARHALIFTLQDLVAKQGAEIDALKARLDKLEAKPVYGPIPRINDLPKDDGSPQRAIDEFYEKQSQQTPRPCPDRVTTPYYPWPPNTAPGYPPPWAPAQPYVTWTMNGAGEPDPRWNGRSP